MIRTALSAISLATAFSVLLLSAFTEARAAEFDEVVAHLGGRSRSGQCLGPEPEPGSRDRIPEADWTCRVLKRHAERDSQDSCLPATGEIFGSVGRQPTNWITVSGTHSFYGTVPLPYAYDFRVGADGAPRVRVLIHLYAPGGISPERLAAMKAKYSRAAEFWTRSSPVPGARFFVQLVDTPDLAHFSLFLQESYARGPCQLRVSEVWDEKTLAHELGHYLGLDEEYPELNNEPLYAAGRSAERESVMASGDATTPYPIHYYWIWRRARCAVAQ